MATLQPADKSLRFSIVILLAFLLSSCSTLRNRDAQPSLVQVDLVATPTPMNTPTALPPTATSSPTPSPTPTLIPNADFDGDGLPNYDEIAKYSTDPYFQDSDGDGIPDSDWDERREYVYTVHIVLSLREPFDIETMNDLFQDVRVIDGPDKNGYSTLDVLIYPETDVQFNTSPYPLTEIPPDIMHYTQPGIAADYDDKMQVEVLDIVGDADTDRTAVYRLLQWVGRNTSNYLDYSIPEVYYTYLRDGDVRVRNYNDALPVNELLRTHYFASSMFAERTHGTCTSIATLKCAMLKAAGIPCRVIQTIFPIYYHEDQSEQYDNSLSRVWGCSYEQVSGQSPMWCNHAFIEIYFDGRWVRADRNLGIYHEGNCLSLKILSVSDWSQVDFSRTWPVDWITSRPYYTHLIEDQEAIH